MEAFLSPAINQLIRALWYLIPLAILVAILKSPWFKGVIGEFMVNLAARLMLNKDEYHLINNVTLPTEDGTTQIDHIIVSRYGVFVVETKNMKGWIFGNANDKMWTQKIFGHSSRFQNPLHQNYKHVKTVESLLGLNDGQVHSVVVFVGDSKFKTEIPENVTYGGGYIRFIKSKNKPLLTQAEVDAIVRSIAAGRLTPSFKTAREHIKHVKQIVSEKKTKNACPKCGSVMVLRETKSGHNAGKPFWGCSNYPHCRGIVTVA